MAYDAATGRQVWARRFGKTGYHRYAPDALALSADGSRLFVTGHSHLLGPEYVTVAYDASTGATFWASRYVGLYVGLVETSGLAVSPDGSRVFVTCDSGNDYATVACNAR